MYFPFFEQLERGAKRLCRWFFVTFLFVTKELQNEATVYFASGQTSLRAFEWLSVSKLKATYPGRWKYVMADYIGAYLKLIMLNVLFCIAGIVIAKH